MNCLFTHSFIYLHKPGSLTICPQIMEYFTKRTGPGPGPSEKANPGSLEEVDPIPNFTVVVKDLFLTNLRELISNMTIVY